MKHVLPIPALFLVLLFWTPLNAQVRLDSIVRYTFTSNGNDSLPVNKHLFDYDGNGRLSTERDLTSTNFVHWTDALRKKYIYNSQGRLERINKDSFTSSSTWKNYFYQKRAHTSDSDYVVRYYQKTGSTFDTLPKINRISLFADGSRKALTKMYYDDFSQSWIAQQFDSLVRDYHKNEVIREYTAGRLFHYSGPANNFFRLDSVTSPIFNLKYRSYTFELPNPPSNKRIYISISKKSPDFKEYYTSDSLVYFLNSNGLPDSSHKYVMFWNAPQYNGLRERHLYTWKGLLMTGHTTALKSGPNFLYYEKQEFSESLGGLIKDTIFYKNDGLSVDKETKETTVLDKNGRIQSITYSRWSSIVDSFSIDEKDIYYYSDPATGVSTTPAEAGTLKVFPIPSTGWIHIETHSTDNLVLYDLHGKVLRHIHPNRAKSIHIKEKGVFLLKQPSSGQVLRVVIR